MNITPGFLSYVAAFGRLGALRSKALRPSMVEDLVEAGNLQACLSILRQAPMIDEAMPQGEQSLREIEHALRDGYLEYGARLLRFIQGGPADFFRCILAEADLWNAKILLRRLSFPDEFSSELLEEFWYKKRLVTSLEIGEDEPTAQSDLSVWKDRLQRSWLGRQLSLDESAGDMEDIYMVEAFLDARFNRAVWMSAGHLDSRDCLQIRNRMLAPFYGTMELTWALRLRFYYNETSANVFEEFRVLREWLGRQTLVELLHLDTLEHALEQLWSMDAFPPEVRELERPESISDLEIILRRWAWSCVSRRGADSPITGRGLTSFMLSQRMLIDDVVIVLQAKQFGLSREETVKQLASIDEGVAASA